MIQIYSLGAALVIVAGFVGAIAAILHTWSEYGDKAISALLYVPFKEPQPQPKPASSFEEPPSGALRFIVPTALLTIWLSVCGGLIMALI